MSGAYIVHVEMTGPVVIEYADPDAFEYMITDVTDAYNIRLIERDVRDAKPPAKEYRLTLASPTNGALWATTFTTREESQHLYEQLVAAFRWRVEGPT